MSNEAEKTILEQIEALRETPEMQTLIKNSNESYWNSKIGSEVATIHGAYDGVVESVLGLKKEPTVKSTEQVKAILLEYKTLKENKGKGSEAQQVDNSEKMQLMEAKLEKLQSALTEKDETLLKLTVKNKQGKVNSKLDAALTGKTFKAIYSEEDINEVVSVRKGRLLSRSKIVENADGTESIVYYKDAEKTKPYTNAIGDPLTSKEVVEQEFSTLFAVTKKGGNTPQTTKEVAEGKAITLDMSGIKTKAQFYAKFNEVMAPKGMASHEEEFLEIQRATQKLYKIEALPLN